MLYVFGEWTLNTQRYMLSRAGCVIPLRRKAFQVLTYLLAHPDRVISKQELCEQVWPQQFISDAALESTMKAVRQAIGDSGRRQQLIQTVYGAGYRLIVPVEERPAPAPEDEGMAPPLEPPAAPPVLDPAEEDRLPAPAVRTALPDEPTAEDATSGSFLRALDAERRQLTVLVCALMAEPPLARPLAPDDLYAVIRTYQETCARIIRQFDGQIVQYRGEELVVYFGYPQAHDEDPQRAVRAGLRLVDALGKQPPRLPHEPGIHWAVRVGVHTGLVVVGPLGDGGPHDQWALGDTPTLAARLHERAAPDTVVISEATQRLIHGYFLCHPLGAPPSQSMATPLQAYRVVRESEAQHRLDVVTTGGLTPFVGREHELGLLVECWEQAKEGRGRIAVINGEAGIGKSRLVRVLQEHLAAEPPTEMVWRGSPYDQQSALHPVLRHLQRLLRVRPEDAPTEILQRLEAVLESYGLALPEVVPLFAALLLLPLPERYPPLILTPQRQRQQTLDALLELLLAEATRHPVLFIVEDLHWMDPSTLEFLGLLIDQVPTARLLLVLTSRPEFHPSWGFRAHLTPITLGRLSPSQAEIMIQRMGGQVLPPMVQQHLVAHTDGVPLFIEEVTKLVLESERLQAHADHDMLPGPLPTLAIPATLHDTLMARLDRLASSKAVAQLGAVLGRTFPYDVLQAVSPWEEMALQHGLRQLVEAELVYQRGVPPQATYRFKHALIRETAYQSLLKSTRQQYHQRIAQVLETHFPKVAATQPELLAYHCTEAGLIAQAIPYWQRAGQQASDRSAHVEAISHFTTGIALLKTLPETPERTQHALTLHIALGMALQMTTGLAAPEVEHAYTQAYALCQQVGETPELFQVLLGLWRFYLLRPQLHLARELGETLLRLAQQTDDPALAIIAHYALGMTWFYLGALPAAHMHLEEAIARYTPDQRRVLVFRFGFEPAVVCRGFSAWTLWVLGYPEQALARLHNALALAHELSHPYSLAYARWVVAMASQFRRDVPSVYEHAEATVALSTAQGFTQWAALGTSLCGWALAMQGQGEEGMALVRQGITVYRATGAALFVPYFSALRADICDHLGYTADGLQVLAEAHTLMEQQEERWWEAEIARLRGVLLLRQMETPPAEAETWLQRALDVACRQGAKALELRAAVSLSYLWQRQGKRDEARALLAPVYSWFTEGFDTADLQEAKALLEELA
jgi:class 3 adenylate cyclase/DNA-binding winged helix-turn-helix (wHTH) protein/predicted ATPase